MEPTNELDRLAARLDGPAGALDARAAAPAAGAPLVHWFQLMADRNASDLILVAGEPPTLRIDGHLVRSAGDILDGDDVVDLVAHEMAPHAQRDFAEQGIADAAVKVPGLGRFRINLHRERGRAAANIRRLPTKIPALSSLNLPPGVAVLSQLTRGLVIIGGATGSGKSTTLAGIVDEINQRDARHIITIEDPLEYEHTNRKSIIQHVEIGVDAPDFPTALRSALRQAPDVLVIGEMRDPETMKIALAAGETGHLVLTTLHTTDVPSTIARLTDSFPAERQPTIRQEIAASLSAVFVQTLMPSLSGARVPAAELLVLQYGARQHIRRNTLHQLHQEITVTRKYGSFTLEDCLAKLVTRGVVDRAAAAVRVNHPDDFESALRSI
jgi:twitching motility protein PilT